jgi:hypothetical protein
MRHVCAALLALLTNAGAANPADAAMPVVVELFTSQGCSSCPPADALLVELARTRPDVLPLAFHVTYWNYLGWRDPFSLQAATDRQADYVRDLGLDGAFTPQMIVNGRVSEEGSDRGAVLGAVAAQAGLPSVAAISLSRQADAVAIDIAAAAAAGGGPATAWLIGYDAARHTDIGRGENGGMGLDEANVVRSLTKLGTWWGTALSLRRPLPAGEKFAVILQAADGAILAAATEMANTAEAGPGVQKPLAPPVKWGG